jgi:hypothetical protein
MLSSFPEEKATRSPLVCERAVCGHKRAGTILVPPRHRTLATWRQSGAFHTQWVEDARTFKQLLVVQVVETVVLMLGRLRPSSQH